MDQTADQHTADQRLANESSIHYAGWGVAAAPHLWA